MAAKAFARWLQENDLSPTAFARANGIPHSTILRIIEEDRAPSPAVAQKILEATKGAVTPNDFYDLSAYAPGGA
jgi:predicted transcriptional regulator